MENRNNNQTSFGVSFVPYHTHNGQDSPQIKSSSLLGGTSNNVAGALATETTIVNISDSAAPTLGKGLVATDSTHATWQTLATGDMTKSVYDPAAIDQQLVGTTATQSITHKTITDSTNTVAANSLKSATTLVDVSAATAPSNGQVLTATSTTAAVWANPSVIATPSLSSTFTANENISANAAVAAGTLAPLCVNSQVGQVTIAGSNNGTISYTAGSNANTVLIFVVKIDSGLSLATASYAGTSMNIFATGIHTNAWWLAAPSSGANNIVWNTGNGSGDTFEYAIYEYKSANQSTAPESFAQTDNSGATTMSNTIATASDNVVVLGVGFAAQGNTNAGLSQSTNMGNNQSSVATKVVAGDSGPIGTPQTITQTVSKTGTATLCSIVSIAITAFSSSTLLAQNASSTASNPRLSFVGFAASTVTTGNTFSVYTSGIVGGFTGILTGTGYYLNDTNGTIGTLPGTVTRKIGIGVSSTQILIANIW